MSAALAERLPTGLRREAIAKTEIVIFHFVQLASDILQVIAFTYLVGLMHWQKTKYRVRFLTIKLDYWMLFLCYSGIAA
ncbi:hypothetical protein I8748_28005 [Nostoc sp. CENA67]|uniref:Uncharacterized protein n=1 Tax=Amazonocrinis nigriterrae CENA67 TaxID=2794033 RepID=A0A8J7I0K3_9NOST|nr:hypothetical protein [Amazonocrinis nigriterrae]MBH8565964.1 hypothetical protein [Amazonocrinis nigriterrae CENA67]